MDPVWNFRIISNCDKGLNLEPLQYFAGEPQFDSSAYAQIENGDVVWVKTKFIARFYRELFPNIAPYLALQTKELVTIPAPRLNLPKILDPTVGIVLHPDLLHPPSMAYEQLRLSVSLRLRTCAIPRIDDRKWPRQNFHQS
jgi:hypothetical protein